MPKDETAILHADGENVPLESSGPYREEMEQEINAERLTGDPARGGDAATAPLRQGSLGEKDSESTQGANPKNKANAKPD